MSASSSIVLCDIVDLHCSQIFSAFATSSCLMRGKLASYIVRGLPVIHDIYRSI